MISRVHPKYGVEFVRLFFLYHISICIQRPAAVRPVFPLFNTSIEYVERSDMASLGVTHTL